ncbi:hypothetical protein [Micromonospora fluostatini]|uniref:hypothetical protein n=1 Tax=Micromonospora sp. JCM 30529 TaxID=3421643 RepID=UPI003D17B0C2
MSRRRVRRAPLRVALAARVAGGAVTVPSPARAASPVLPGNEGDVGVTDYYLDRVLGGPGTLGSAVLMTRGRSLYLRGANNANFTTMGFAGSAHVGGPNNLGNLYTVTVPGQTVTEVAAHRFDAPSHARSRYTIGTTWVTADLTKFVTDDNVAVTVVTFSNPGGSAATLTVRAASPLATRAGPGTAALTCTCGPRRTSPPARTPRP